MPYYDDGVYYDDYEDYGGDTPTPATTSTPMVREDSWGDSLWDKSSSIFDSILGMSENYGEWWLRSEAAKALQPNQPTTVVDETKPPPPPPRPIIKDDKTMIYVGVGVGILALVLALKR